MGISYPLSSRSWDRIKEAIYIYIQTGPLSPTNLATSANPGSGSAEAVQLLRFRSPGSVGLCHDGLMVVARRLWWWWFFSSSKPSRWIRGRRWICAWNVQMRLIHHMWRNTLATLTFGESEGLIPASYEIDFPPRREHDSELLQPWSLNIIEVDKEVDQIPFKQVSPHLPTHTFQTVWRRCEEAEPGGNPAFLWCLNAFLAFAGIKRSVLSLSSCL